MIKKSYVVKNRPDQNDIVSVCLEEPELFDNFCQLCQLGIYFSEHYNNGHSPMSLFQSVYFYGYDRKIDFILNNNYCQYMTEEDKHVVFKTHKTLSEQNHLDLNQKKILKNIKILKNFLEKQELYNSIENKTIRNEKLNIL